jgi:hypothetical protein
MKTVSLQCSHCCYAPITGTQWPALTMGICWVYAKWAVWSKAVRLQNEPVHNGASAHLSMKRPDRGISGASKMMLGLRCAVAAEVRALSRFAVSRPGTWRGTAFSEHPYARPFSGLTLSSSGISSCATMCEWSVVRWLPRGCPLVTQTSDFDDHCAGRCENISTRRFRCSLVDTHTLKWELSPVAAIATCGVALLLARVGKLNAVGLH